jgi:hypothetical protein
MAGPATAPRRIQARPAPAPRRPDLGVVGPAPRRRRRSSPRRRAGVVAIVIAVGSLLSVAAAQADLAQNQVQLTHLQQRLDRELATHHDLELHVAQLQDPSAVIGQAQGNGLVPAGQITDVPEVPLSSTPKHS